MGNQKAKTKKHDTKNSELRIKSGPYKDTSAGTTSDPEFMPEQHGGAAGATPGTGNDTKI